MAETKTLSLPLEDDFHDPGYRIELGHVISLSQGSKWAARISKRRLTTSGNEGKPDHVITLLHDDDPVALLRQVADLFEAGEVEMAVPD